AVCGHVVVFVLLLFFFSSRRRHTRSKRDWSSDVCSSDLKSAPATAPWHTSSSCGTTACTSTASRAFPQARRRARRPAMWPCPVRSEERRVGKECRRRGGAEREEKRE